MSQPAAFTRLNQREADPNPSFGFITALSGKPQEEKALSIMKALAAQVKAICKTHGLKVYSFEEHPYNTVFAGRNWNAGEAVEIVLRRKNNEFFPSPWLISVVCHELAHIKHMNHGPGFQKFNEQLKREVAIMQSKGNYGDGFWSSGARLKDSLADHENVLLGAGDFAENICGGAQRRQRPAFARRRRGNNALGAGKGLPSLHSGAQTTKKRKSGTRNLLSFRDAIDGNRVDGNKILTEKEKREISSVNARSKKTGANLLDPGSTYRKRAGSRSAAESRANAAEKRIKKLQGLPTTSDEGSSCDSADENKDESVPKEYEPVPETDAEKRIAQQTSLLEEEEDETTTKAKDKETGSLYDTKAKSKINFKDAPNRTIQNGFDAYLETIKIKSEPTDLPAYASENYKALNTVPTDPLARDLTKPTKYEHPAWACGACTFLNSGLLYACEICEQPRGVM